LLLTVLIFLVDRFFAAFCLLLFFIIIRKFAKIQYNGVKNLKFLTLLAVFIVLLQAFFGPGENFIIKPLFPDSFPFVGGMGYLKLEGLMLGLVIVCRFYALIILFSVFTGTTSPYSLAAGLNTLGFSYTSAFVITMTFNLTPFFREETLTITDAQKMRGMSSLEKGFFFPRLKAYCGLALPLVLGAMRKAQTSSVVMDSRAFGIYKERTWLDKPEMKAGDFFFLFACVIFSSAVLCLNFLFKWEYLCRRIESLLIKFIIHIHEQKNGR
jgi:energy-coupling factor transport system permease protein